MTTTTVRGVIRGATIVLNEPPAIADGVAVELQIRTLQPPSPTLPDNMRGPTLADIAELVRAHQLATPAPATRSRAEIDADLATLRDEAESEQRHLEAIQDAARGTAP